MPAGPPRTITVAPWRDTVVLVVFCAGLVTSGVVYGLARGYDRAEEKARFEAEAKLLARQVEQEVVPAAEIVAGVAGLFAASEDVTEEEFVAFTRSALRRHESLAALEWAPRVLASERAAFEAGSGLAFPIREPDGAGGMKRAPDRNEYFPLRHMAPKVDSVLGLDLAFEAGRRADIDRAIESGELTLSRRFRLVEDPEGVHSVSVYAAVFAHDDKARARRDAVSGLAIGLFRVAPLVRRAVNVDRLGDLGLLLVDDDAPDALRELFVSSERVAPALRRAPPEEIFEAAFVVGDRTWKVLCVSLEPLGSRQPLGLLLVSLAITLITTAGFGVARHLGRLRRQVNRAKRLGQYRLVAKLGEGGMGAVYVARHTMMRRPTAVKVIRSDAVGEQTLLRFEREVHAAASLSHPNCITVYDFGRTADGSLYYAMELVQGIDLDALVRATGPLPQARVVHLLAQACGALGEAHARGLVHRDIKPGNLMVCQQGGIDDFLKVLDFGLVKTVEPIDGNRELSRDVQFIGTPHYMAPEQIVSPSEVDARADVYALGGVAYFLLAGMEVFTGTTSNQIVSKCLTQPPVPLSERLPHSERLHPELEALVMRCLEKAPEKRPPDALALRHLLLALDIPKWTEADAAQWWYRTGQPLTTRRREATSQRIEVLTVDLGERNVTAPAPPSPTAALDPK